MSEITQEKAIEIAANISQGIGGEICAAIAMALDRCQEGDGVHDQESFVLTIRPAFSAWADRHSTLRQLPERKK